jgi:hypothetical protein
VLQTRETTQEEIMVHASVRPSPAAPAKPATAQPLAA